MARLELLIFDMDGLMFDTGRLAYRAYLESAKKNDFEVTPDVYYYLTGRTERSIIQGMHEIYGAAAPVELWRADIVAAKNEILAREGRVYKKAGLLKLIEAARQAGLELALASSTARGRILEYLEMEKMSGVMNFIVSAEDMRRGKPAPDVFLAAARLAEVPESRCLVFEDSAVGIAAARSAGIRSVWVEDDIRDLAGLDGKWHLLNEDLLSQARSAVVSDFKFDDLGQAADFLTERDFVI